MKQLRLASFQREHEAFALRFTCEHCSYFDIATEQCSHGYPNAAHRDAAWSAQELVFCKEFELM